MTEHINCPNGHGKMAVALLEKTQEFRGKKIYYQIESYVCDTCGIEIGTIEQTAAAQNAIADAYRAKENLLTGEEIRTKRAENGWSQKDLARKAGVGIASIKRWENGIVQTKSMNQALKSAFQGHSIGNIYTGNRARISLTRVKLVLKKFEEELGFRFLNEGDMLLFDVKYAWYADMLAYRILGKSITGATYAALPHGPQLNNYKELVKLIHEADESKAEPLNEEELRIIARVAKTFPSKQQVIDAAHREDVFNRKSAGAIIPYSDAEGLTEI